METWYEACSSRVDPVEVERSTEQSVWIGGRRVSRVTDWRCFFPSEQEAWDWVQARAEGKLSEYQEHVHRYKLQLEKVIAARRKAGF
jgi:hypothetical protein